MSIDKIIIFGLILFFSILFSCIIYFDLTQEVYDTTGVVVGKYIDTKMLANDSIYCIIEFEDKRLHSLDKYCFYDIGDNVEITVYTSSERVKINELVK